MEDVDDVANEAAGDVISDLVSDPREDLPPVSELTPAPGVETVYFFPMNADKCMSICDELMYIYTAHN